jgi:NTP pyrophosphatase (non-canonical NTP hydrolase)
MNRDIFIEQLREVTPHFDPKWQDEVIKSSIESNLPDGNPYGHRNLIIVMEELSELQKEVSKELRGKGDKYAMLEEIADVEIGKMYLKQVCNISDEDIAKAVQIKLRRLENVLEEKGVFK